MRSSLCSDLLKIRAKNIEMATIDDVNDWKGCSVYDGSFIPMAAMSHGFLYKSKRSISFFFVFFFFLTPFSHFF